MGYSVLSTFSELKRYVNLKVDPNNVSTDNIIFKLHYRASFLILLAGVLLVSSQQYFGDHIDCVADDSVRRVINSFCFFTATFTVVKHMNETSVKMGEIPAPGVGYHTAKDETVFHRYYQWVPFVLFFQALLFYLPHAYWREHEGGRLKFLLSGLRTAFISFDDQSISANGVSLISKHARDEKIHEIRRAFMTRLHVNRHWAFYLTLCEFFNLIVIILQFFITDWFLQGGFRNLGYEIINTDWTNAMDCLDVVFPKMTKCTFHKYGQTGEVQKHDALCVMSLNIINEKIYAFLWFWFVFVFLASVMGLLWRFICMILHSRSVLFNKIVFGFACPGKYNPWDILRVDGTYHFSDWLFLYYMAKNLDNYVFKILVTDLISEPAIRNIRLAVRDEKEPLKSR